MLIMKMLTPNAYDHEKYLQQMIILMIKMFTANDHYDHPTILPSLTPYLPSMPRPKGPFPHIFPIFIKYFSVENFLRHFDHTNDS